MVFTPVLRAFMIPSLAWQCAATALRAPAASSSITFSSSGENCASSTLSISLKTPPLVQALMNLAPLRSCRRIVRIQSSTPSQLLQQSRENGYRAQFEWAGCECPGNQEVSYSASRFQHDTSPDLKQGKKSDAAKTCETLE